MANLAIKGHATRSEEVIQLLEMLGGKNIHRHDGKSSEFVYVINSSYKGEIDCFYAVSDVYKVYTLEQFLEKFPYKVGDKVNVCGENAALVIGMRWEIDYVLYRVRMEKNGYETSKIVEELQPYTEQKPLVIKENFYDSPCTGSVRAEEQTYLNPKAEEAKEEIKENLKEAKTIMEETIKIDIPKGYEFAGVDDNNQQVVLERIKPQYPKTYDECCEVLGLGTMDTDAQGYKCLLIMRFQELLIARDAYWKMAGDWKPDWQNRKEAKYGIIFVNNERYDETTNTTSILLAFPTEEMRDNFFENFKELIEECKELL